MIWRKLCFWGDGKKKSVDLLFNIKKLRNFNWDPLNFPGTHSNHYPWIPGTRYIKNLSISLFSVFFKFQPSLLHFFTEKDKSISSALPQDRSGSSSLGEGKPEFKTIEKTTVYDFTIFPKKP